MLKPTRKRILTQGQALPETSSPACAMTVVKLEHSNLAHHQANIFKRLRTFRNKGQLCDIVLKSSEGTEHQAHTAVLCAASVDFSNMLVGSFLEAGQVQQGQPVELAASDAVVLALLEYIYGNEPQHVEFEDSLELLRLADAYDFPELAAAIEKGLRAALDSAPVTTALKLLRQAWDLHQLKAACEKKVAANFETCIELDDFLELSACQLGRVLRREDLNVSCEEVVVKGLFNWSKRSKDRGICLGALLHHLDLQSLSSDNLARLGHLSASMGPVGHDLQGEVAEALLVHKKRNGEITPDAFPPKRQCLRHWSPGLGASWQPPRKVLPYADALSWKDGAIYYAPPDPFGSTVFCWKPGDTVSRAVAGRGARVNGVNDLGGSCEVFVSPHCDFFVIDKSNRRFLRFSNGCGDVVLSDVYLQSVSCSQSGAVYILTQNGRAVEKLVGATLHPLISSEHLPADLQFDAADLFVTKDEVVYISDYHNSRVLRIKQGEVEPVVVGEAPNKETSNLLGLFVTEEGKVYVADEGQGKVWVFHPGDAVWTEVLVCPGYPVDVLVEGRSLYVTMVCGPDESGIFEYLLPSELQLE